MQAAKREDRNRRWAVWYTAALPLMKRFPTADAFIDPAAQAAQQDPVARTFMAMRQFSGGEKPPDWVLSKFGLPSEGAA